MSVALLWHLHQPDYRHPRTGRPVMPWVRLHALRGYRDVPLEILERGARCTVNLVPSLLDQLLAYAEGGTDDHLQLTRTPATDLTSEQIQEIRTTFVAGNAAMVDCRPAYRRLRSRVVGPGRLDVTSLRDLQVWSTLAWMGHTAVRDFEVVRALLEKGEAFTEGDKEALLEVQGRILTEIPPLLARLAASEHAEVSTSPYFHPILPLLVDARHARRCLAELTEDVDFAWPEDARWQLEHARSRMAEVLGVAPVGLWPSEGSVSPEVAALAAEAGFTWIASDEEVLARSSRSAGEGSGPWLLGDGLHGLFRNRDVSDFIGFSAARLAPRDAVAQLVTRLERAGARESPVLVALDGENPWEAFPDAGGAFRAALFTALEGPGLRGVTCAEAASADLVGEVRSLHTGSWIHADFAIWIGDAEDRAGWRLLSAVRAAAEQASSERRERAMERIRPAEGSDWFWWFGSEFSTPFASVFDALFRAWIRAAWQELGLPVPPEVDQPIKAGTTQRLRAPVQAIEPGLVADAPWIRWAGAGAITWPPGGAMSLGVRHLGRAWFGWSPGAAHLWLRVRLPKELPTVPDGRWRLCAGDVVLELPYGEPGATVRVSGGAALHGVGDLVACIDGAALPEEAVPLWVSVLSDGVEVARYPAYGRLELPRPTQDPGLDLWTV